MDAQGLVERYLETWNETDPEVRRSAVARVLGRGRSILLDPLASVSGHDQISDLIGAVQEQALRHVFRLVNGDVDAQHNVMRFRWRFVPASAATRSRSGST